MRKRKAQIPARQDPTDAAIAWFGVLAVAVESGDFDAAAKVQRTLAGLGWVVSRRRV